MLVGSICILQASISSELHPQKLSCSQGRYSTALASCSNTATPNHPPGKALQVAACHIGQEHICSSPLCGAKHCSSQKGEVKLSLGPTPSCRT